MSDLVGNYVDRFSHVTATNTVNQLFFAAIYFLRFCHHEHFHGDLFSRTAELDYDRTM